MITENIFKDLNFTIEVTTDRTKIHAYLRHKYLPLTFSHTQSIPPKGDTILYVKENLDLLIHQLYKEVLDCALYGKPDRSTHTEVLIPCWSKKAQAWYYLDEEENEIFTIPEK